MERNYFRLAARIPRFTTAALAIGLSGTMLMAHSGGSPAHSAPVSTQKADQAPMTWDAWIGTLWPEARAQGISQKTFQAIFAKLEPDCTQPGVYCKGVQSSGIAFKDFREKGLPETCFKITQREFLRPAGYFPQTYMNNLVQHARQLLQNWQKTQPETYKHLLKIEAEYGVSINMLLALWGRETSFGRAPLKYNAIRSLASMAYATVPARRDWARKQLLAALKMVDEGHVTAEALKSSYAGATGLTQLMPDEFMAYAVDADGDGRKDVWNSIPDALASTANVLRANGWKPDAGTWGHEARLPEKSTRFDCTLESRVEKRPYSEWTAGYGLIRVEPNGARQQKPPKADTPSFLVLPAGTLGPAFVATENFEVLRRYNTSDVYALFIGSIADRIGCDTDKQPCRFERGWPKANPADDFEFSVETLCRLQIALKDKGFSDATPDGLFGVQTRVGIGRYQKSLGRQPDCYPTRSLYQALISAAAPKAASAGGEAGKATRQ